MTSPPPKVDGQALVEAFRRYLRDHNLPVTQQREAVASALFFSDAHLSVGDLQRELAAQGEHVGTATVYRTLELLARAGLVQEHDFDEGFKRYEALAAEGRHEHLICTNCGRVVEFSNDRLERMSALIAEDYGFRYRRHRLEIYGVCRDCQRRDAASLQTPPSHDEGTGR